MPTTPAPNISPLPWMNPCEFLMTGGGGGGDSAGHTIVDIGRDPERVYNGCPKSEYYRLEHDELANAKAAGKPVELVRATRVKGVSPGGF